MISEASRDTDAMAAEKVKILDIFCSILFFFFFFNINVYIF